MERSDGAAISAGRVQCERVIASLTAVDLGGYFQSCTRVTAVDRLDLRDSRGFAVQRKMSSRMQQKDRGDICTEKCELYKSVAKPSV